MFLIDNNKVGDSIDYWEANEIIAKDYDPLQEMNKYFNRPYLTTTYKPVLLKSFLHAVLRKKQGFKKLDQHLFEAEEGLYISLDYIASCFVSINWPLYKKYRLKQVTNKGVTLGVYNVFDQYNFHSRRKPKYTNEILEDIIKILKKDVLYRLRKNCITNYNRSICKLLIFD